MVSKIKSGYNFIVEIGSNKAQDPYEAKKIRLLNIFGIIWLHISLSFIFLDVFFQPSGAINDIIIHSICIATILSILLLNSSGYIWIGRVIFILLAYIAFYILSFVHLFSQFTVCYFILLPPLVMSLYKSNKPAYIMLFICMATFNLNDAVHGIKNSTDMVDIQMMQNIKTVFNGEVHQMELFRLLIMMKDPVVTTLFFASFYLFHYFKRSNERNEGLLEIEKDKVLNDKIILEQQQKELKELNEFKSHFFVNLSHEIRTPLTLINGHASRIDFKKSVEENKENLDIVNSQTKQIQSIVNNILDLSKIDEKNFKIEREPIVLIPFLNKHYANFKGLFEKKRIEFKLEIDRSDIVILCDENLFSKSINNLLNNALKFSIEGGQVKISVNSSDQGVSITISDTGIGIPEEDRVHVFKRFYQSKNHITKSKGSGIGLSFTKSIIDAHGYTIALTSVPNTSTKFIIQIPNNFIESEKKPFVVGSKKMATSISNKKELPLVKKKINKLTPRILIVDDHEQMRHYLSKVLDKYEIEEAEHGKEALRILATQSFDVIISDYMMPIMDGEAFVKELKRQKNKTPILVLTARSDNQGKLKMLRLGIDGYLNKPFLEEELLLNIKKAIQSSNTIKEFDATLSKEETKTLNTYADKFNKDLNEFIFLNIKSPTFGIDDIAGHLNVSKSTLNRKVKSILGQTPKDLVMEARLQKARILLEENPTETQKNIAEAVGISNTSYFFRKMEERFGRLK